MSTNGRKCYTIVRNGTIQPDHIGEHHCGFAATNHYPYRVEMKVSGQLQGPQYFIVANEEIDEVVQAAFAGQPSVSCEKMADVITDAVLGHMTNYPQWTVQKVHVSLTGTNGLADLSCDWESDTTPANDLPDHWLDRLKPRQVGR